MKNSIKDKYSHRLFKGRLASSIYTEYISSFDIEPDTVLYSAYRNKTMSGNPYAIFKYLIEHEEYSHLIHIWAYDNDAWMDHDTFSRYKDHPRVILVRKDELGYLKALATSRYFIHNAAFPNYWQKRPGQTYLNTWHGTPLKSLGLDALDYSESSISNAMRNFLLCDYIALQNRHSIDIILDSYNIRGIFGGSMVDAGAARTDLVLGTDKDRIRNLLAKHSGLDLTGKKIVLYAPTFRSIEGKSIDNSDREISYILDLVENVPEEYVVFFKIHNMMGAYFADNKRISGRLLFDEIETNELLAATDILITDYSSIFFDYMCTKRPVIFFTYDLDDYIGGHGLYLDPSTLPGDLCFSVEDIVASIRKIDSEGFTLSEEYNDYLNRFCYNDDGHSSERIVRIMFDGDKSLGSYISGSYEEKDNLLFELGNANNALFTCNLISMLKNLDKDRERAIVSCKNTRVLYSMIKDVEGDIRVFGSNLTPNATIKEKLRLKRDPDSMDQAFYDRQRQKFFGDLPIRQLFKLNQRKTFTRHVFPTIDVEPGCDFDGKPLTVLFMATYDSMNNVIAPVARALVDQGHMAIVYIYNKNDEIAKKPFNNVNIECIPAGSFVPESISMFDMVVTTPVNLAAFSEIMDAVRAADIPVISFATLFSSIAMRTSPDFVFCIGRAKVREFEKNHLRYNCILAGNPQYDKISSSFDDSQKEIHRVLIIDQGGYPYGEKGKRDLAETLCRIAELNPDKIFDIKPRILAREKGRSVHAISELLIDYLDETPANLSFINHPVQLESIIGDYDALITTWSTAYLDALVRNMPMILIDGFDSRDVFDVRIQRVEEAYDRLRLSGCVVDYHVLQNEKVPFRTADPAYAEDEVYNIGKKCIDRIIKCMLLIKSELKDQKKGLLPDYSSGIPVCTVDDFEDALNSVKHYDTEDPGYRRKKRYYIELNDIFQEYAYIHRCMGYAPDISFFDEFYNDPGEGSGFLQLKRTKDEWNKSMQAVFSDYINGKDFDEEIKQSFYFDWLFNNNKKKELLNYDSKVVAEGDLWFYRAKIKFRSLHILKSMDYSMNYIKDFCDGGGEVNTINDRRIESNVRYFARNDYLKMIFYHKLGKSGQFRFLDYFKDYITTEHSHKVMLSLYKDLLKNGETEKAKLLYGAYYSKLRNNSTKQRIKSRFKKILIEHARKKLNGSK